MRLLVVEDDPMLARTMVGMLRDHQNTVDLLSDGQQALTALQEESFDLVILDLTLPRLDGLEVLRRARQAGNQTPVIILTARAELDEKLQGLDAGADDYLTKPFHNEELLARTKALIRRASGQANPTIQFGPIALDTVSEELSLNGQALDLTAYEYKVMEYLMLNPNKVISKTELTEHIYDQDFDLDSNVIEVFIGRLRKKLDPSGDLKPIETLRGRGYRINKHL